MLRIDEVEFGTGLTMKTCSLVMAVAVAGVLGHVQAIGSQIAPVGTPEPGTVAAATAWASKATDPRTQKNGCGLARNTKKHLALRRNRLRTVVAWVVAACELDFRPGGWLFLLRHSAHSSPDLVRAGGQNAKVGF